MKLKKLLHGIENNLPRRAMARDVKSIKIDPQKVEPGDVFLLLKDDKFSKKKIAQAFKRGATIALASRDYGIKSCFVVSRPRLAFAVMEKRLHKCACDKMKIIGVTGTNGKTTTTNIIYHILSSAGKKVGIIGSLGYKIDGEWIETGFTTPDPDMMHEIFQKMKNEKVEYVVMEVSAHALELEKMEGITCEVGVLTNITQDHLDFFGDMTNYSKAKYKLFDGKHCKRAVVCVDDVSEDEFALKCKVPYVSCGLENASDVFGAIISQSLSGSEFFCGMGGNLMRASIPLVGTYNIENALAAIATCALLGIDAKKIISCLKDMLQVDGRFNVIERCGKTIVIDFAHTPDGLEKVIKTTKNLTKNRVLVVFGCGGDRDAIKRPIMGKISTTLCDMSYFTSDNPRFEDPDSIVQQIAFGAVNKNFVCQPDRKKAIELALDEAHSGDVVIIAGKGTEKYQDICGKKIPYDDYSQVCDYFARKS